MIVVTGAAGFIASCLVGALNNKGIKDIVIVDDFTKEQKLGNWETKEYAEKVDRNVFFKWFDDNYNLQDFYIKGWEFDYFKEDKIIIVYSDIFRMTHSVDVTFDELLKYE